MLLDKPNDLVFYKLALSHGYLVLYVTIGRPTNNLAPWAQVVPCLQLSKHELWGSLQVLMYELLRICCNHFLAIPETYSVLGKNAYRPISFSNIRIALIMAYKSW